MTPLAALRAWRLRRAARLLARYSGYNAAEASRLDSWQMAGQSINLLVSGAGPRLRSRVRDLVRNFPLFTRAVNGYTAYVLGQGARFQSLAMLPDGTPNKPARAAIETRFKAWMDEADIGRRMHWYEMQALLCRQIMETGEALFVKKFRRSGWRINPFCLMPLEDDRLSSLGAAPDGNARLLDGVEYDPASGQALAFHVLDDGYGGRVDRVPAADMLHLFQTLRPGQLRGVTPFAPAILFARAMADYTQAELDAAKMQSKYLAFVKSGDPQLFQNARNIRLPGKGGNPAEQKSQPVENLENAVIEYLRSGEDIILSSPPSRPGDAFNRFENFVARMVSVTTDVPYELISGDYSGVNYSTLKASRVDSQMLLIPHKQLLEHQNVAPVFRAWLDCDALTRPDLYPHYWDNPELYRKGRWIHGGLPSVDPLRDGNADVLAVNNGFKAPQEVIMARGGDPDEVLSLSTEWASRRNAALDLPEAGPMASMKNNPAALGAAETPPEQGDTENGHA